MIKLLQFFFIRTNPYWPFSFLNRLPYYLAIQVFVWRCKKYSFIKSVYLRHSLTGKDWEPGISDIDISIFLYPNLEHRTTFDFLNHFWKLVQRIQFFFPMLSDIKILPENYFPKVAEIDFLRGIEAKEWKLLYGIPLVLEKSKLSPAQILQRSLVFGMMLYSSKIGPRFKETNFIARHQLRRISNKILRYGAKYQRDGNNIPIKTNSLCPIEMKALLLKHFSEYIKKSITGARQEERESAFIKIKINEPQVVNAQEKKEFADLSVYEAQIKCLLKGERKLFLVLKDNLSLIQFETILKTIKQSFQGIELMIFTETMMEFYLTHHTPYLLLQLMQNRKVIIGSDVIKKMPFPTVQAYQQKKNWSFRTSYYFVYNQDFYLNFDKEKMTSTFHNYLFSKIFSAYRKVVNNSEAYALFEANNPKAYQKMLVFLNKKKVEVDSLLKWQLFQYFQFLTQENNPIGNVEKPISIPKTTSIIKF